MRYQAITRLAGLVLAVGLCGCEKPKPRECPESMEKLEAGSIPGKELACKSPDGTHARWTTFHPEGARWHVCVYEAGKAEGPFISFHKNGQMVLRGLYRGGLKVGKWTQRDINGAVVAKGEYRDGQFIAGAPVGMQATCETKSF